MATQRVAYPLAIMRFRNLVGEPPDIYYTIDEHQALITQHGSAYWGWWKKALEANNWDTLVRRVNTGSQVILQAPNEQLQVEASVRRVLRRRPKDAAKIPEYYRHRADIKIPIWL